MNTGDIEKALHNHYKDSKFFFMTQVKNGSTSMSSDLLILDGVAILKSWVKMKMIGYEIKISRSDFLKDNKWMFYQKYVNEFYFICPEGLIDKKEIIDGVGLIYVTNDGLKTIKRPRYEPNKPSMDMLWYIMMSKLDQNQHKSMQLSHRVDAETYLQDKMSSYLLGRKLGTKMAIKLGKVTEELETIQGQKNKLEETVKVVTEYIQGLVEKKIIARSPYNSRYPKEKIIIEAIEELIKKKYDVLGDQEKNNEFAKQLKEVHAQLGDAIKLLS